MARLLNSKSQEADDLIKKQLGPGKNEGNPLYRITSASLLESLYLLLKKYEKASDLFLNLPEENVKIFKYNHQQMKLFFENIFRIKFLQICKPAIKIFLKKFQSKHFKKKNRSGIKKKEKASPHSQSSRTTIDPSIQDNNLSLNLLKSVEHNNTQNFMADFLDTKKKKFEESIRINKEFTSPDLIGNEAFKKIQLTTVKKRRSIYTGEIIYNQKSNNWKQKSRQKSIERRM